MEDNICDGEVPVENYRNFRLMPILEQLIESIKSQQATA